MKRILFLAVTFLAVALFSPQVLSVKGEKYAPQSVYVPGQIFVKVKQPIPLNLQSQLEKTAIKSFDEIGWKLLKLPTGVSVETALMYFQSQQGIVAEPNYLYAAEDIPSSSEMEKLWSLHNTGQMDCGGEAGKEDADIDAPEAWEVSHGNRHVVVAVVDTGIDYKHPDLAGNMWTNSQEIPDNKKDDDNNGFIDDIYGFDFANNDADPLDDHGHGTHVSGTIGALSNENGVVGVNHEVSLMALKFLDSGGYGSLEGAISAIEYATKMGAQVMNNSWGGGGFSQALADAITAAHEKGVFFVAAAGNDGINTDKSPHYPSSYQIPNIIAVAATNNRDELASFSNYGLKTVHISAPGESVWSSVINEGYDCYSGTSMATPHVAGALALLLSVEPTLTVEEVKERIIKTSDEILSLRRKVYSGGRLNLNNLVRNIIPSKTQPVNPIEWNLVAKEISTPHNYENDIEMTWTIQHEGAKQIAVHFSKFETEAGYDFVTILDKNGDEQDKFDGQFDPFWSFTVPGDTITVIFESDSSVPAYGFDIDQYAWK